MRGIAIPICEITSGGVKKAEKIKIPIKKNFLFFERKWWLKIPIFVNKIIRIGNSNDSPLAKSKNIINLIYSEYFDSNSIGNELFKRFSYEIKKFQITGTRK